MNLEGVDILVDLDILDRKVSFPKDTHRQVDQNNPEPWSSDEHIPVFCPQATEEFLDLQVHLQVFLTQSWEIRENQESLEAVAFQAFQVLEV